ncbi:MAG TPA: formylglycine-generating enzyme family protein [Pyrinomonadaceae bacterium]
MPRAQDLPDDLARLSRRNAFEISDLRWRHDVNQLIDSLEKLFAEQQEARRKEEQEAEERRRALEAAAEASRRQAEEQARQAAAAEARRTAQPHAVTNRVGIELVWIPPGSFMMGSENTGDGEQPKHPVIIGEGFYMGKYQVTQAQWLKVMGNNPSHFKGNDRGMLHGENPSYFRKSDELPVEQVSWEDAREFVYKLNTMYDGYEYRLPSEAEWEYACRAGTVFDFSFGSTISSEQANFNGNNPFGAYDLPRGVSRQTTTPVGIFQPNAFGLFDMHGNVWEWCADVWHEDYTGAPLDGSAWLSGGNSKYRVLRGGSWVTLGMYLRSAYRSKNLPSYRDRYIGLRVAASAQP